MQILSSRLIPFLFLLTLLAAPSLAKAQDFPDPGSDIPEQSNAFSIADMLIQVIANNCPCPNDPSVASQVSKFEKCLVNQRIKGNKKVQPVVNYLDKENAGDYKSELSDGLDAYKSDCEAIPDPADGGDDPNL